jgi:Family of unknown function (DUF5946)
MTSKAQQRCPGCGGNFKAIEGPTHAYMISSPACWERYGRILAREYSDPVLLRTHRLSVDAYAVQHPGDGSRRAIQSVGLHLARLMLQLDRTLEPPETNDIMLGLGGHEASLPPLSAPDGYTMTVLDIPLDGTTDDHAAAVRAWASATWCAWSAHHAVINDWVASVLPLRPRRSDL